MKKSLQFAVYPKNFGFSPLQNGKIMQMAKLVSPFYYFRCENGFQIKAETSLQFFAINIYEYFLV